MARILIAENQKDLRDMIAFALRLDGHQAVTTSNGEEALKQAAEVLPDLFILDIHMPRMTGYELCKKLRKHAQFSDAPIIIISAESRENEIQVSLDAGATDYIRKPFAPQVLVSRVNSLLKTA